MPASKLLVPSDRIRNCAPCSQRTTTPRSLIPTPRSDSERFKISPTPSRLRHQLRNILLVVSRTPLSESFVGATVCNLLDCRFGYQMLRCLLLIVVAAATTACAKSPESISPSYVSDVGYQSWQCHQLAEEQRRLTTALTTASGQQENARTGDMVGVLLIGLPVSSMSGDNIAPEIARLKGEQQAVSRALTLKNCMATASLPTEAKQN